MAEARSTAAPTANTLEARRLTVPGDATQWRQVGSQMLICDRKLVVGFACLATWPLTHPLCCAQDAARSGAPEISRLIHLLDADRFEDRERATRELYELGLPAVEALEGVRGHPSAEVRWRAKAVIDALTVGVLRRELAEFAALPDAQLDLEHGMWLIARILNPSVKRDGITKSLDDLAARVRR